MDCTVVDSAAVMPGVRAARSRERARDGPTLLVPAGGGEFGDRLTTAAGSVAMAAVEAGFDGSAIGERRPIAHRDLSAQIAAAVRHRVEIRPRSDRNGVSRLRPMPG